MKEKSGKELEVRKTILDRGAVGVVAGISIGYVITILISLGWGDGSYYPVVPTLIDFCGNEIKAVLLQVVLCGVFGFVCAASSVIWKIDRWSLLKQTILHFVVITGAMFPIAYVNQWMAHTITGVAVYLGIFVVIYVLIWIITYFSWKKKIHEMNQRIS